MAKHDVEGNGKRDYDHGKTRDSKDSGGSGKHGQGGGSGGKGGDKR